jgi:GNAT superfamily N-acetyltransferase
MVNSAQPSPQVAEISLRVELPSDEPFLRRLFAAIRPVASTASGWSDAQRAAFCDRQFNAQQRYYRAEYPNALHQIVQRDDQPLGCLCIHHGRAEVLIVAIALLPEFSRVGIGSAILRGLQDAAQEAGKRLTAHLERGNPALRLFQRLGFQAVEDTGAYVSMTWRPPGAAV